MATLNALIAFFTAVGVGAIFIIAVIATFIAGPAIGFVLFVFLVVVFFFQGLTDIPAEPARRAIPLFWGSYIDAENGSFSLPPGRIFLPFGKLLFDLVLFDSTQISLELSIEERTLDQSELLVEPYFRYVVDPDHPAWFFQKGGEKAAVEEKFAKQVDTRVREWINSPNEGPATGPDALQSNGLAMDVIIQKLFPTYLTPIPPAVIAAIPGGADIPVGMFIKYFTERPPLPERMPKKKESDLKKKEYAVKQQIDALKQTNRPLWNALEAAVRARIADVETVKRGDCGLPIKELGIVVKLAGLGNIKYTGATAAAADKIAEANRAAIVASIASDNFQQQVEKFAKAHGGDVKAATEAIQLLRKLATKTIAEQQFALRQDNAELLSKILGPLGAAWAASITPPGKIIQP